MSQGRIQGEDAPGASPYPNFILNDNQCDYIFQYIFSDNHHKSIEKNAKVRVERSPIFKDRLKYG
jgi:hypothetical protein